MISLELLAPARNKDIGIAAIGCGADAVYIAGPAFGARKDAGNTVSDIKELCDYAHIFGARVFVTLNTILMDEELDSAQELLTQIEDAGADAFIVQDLAVLKLKSRVPLHASTQCSIRTPERARFLESLGFSRVVMERQTSLEQIKDVKDAIRTEIEYFVHGALCVCYSGQCYLSEAIDKRSANRGACIQACRSLYDLVDQNGKTILKNKAVLSLKDYNLIERLEDLAENGVSSFKIEGRLKNASYVKNVVRAYSIALDHLVNKYPKKYSRASFGKVRDGFVPDLNKTFNRGYTELFIDGQRDKWSSMLAPKSMGEKVGTVQGVRKENHGQMSITVRFDRPGTTLKNGDGFAFVSGDSIIGFRADVCQGSMIRCKDVQGIRNGIPLYRNISAQFEKELDSNMPLRLIDVRTDISISGQNGAYTLVVRCGSEDGRSLTKEIAITAEPAANQQRMTDLLRSQISKKTSLYNFILEDIDITSEDMTIPIMGASAINAIRRDCAEGLDKMPCNKIELIKGLVDPDTRGPEVITYKENVSNSLSKEVYLSRGAKDIEQAFELTHKKDAELMRMKYCIRHELGLCPKLGAKPTGTLYLLNNKRRFKLDFDCKACEMILSREN